MRRYSTLSTDLQRFARIVEEVMLGGKTNNGKNNLEDTGNSIHNSVRCTIYFYVLGLQTSHSRRREGTTMSL